MNKSLKFGFKSKPSQTTDDVSNLANFSNTERILRRSKSIECTSNAVSKPILNPSFGNSGIKNIDTKNATKSESTRAEDTVPEPPVINERPIRTNLRRSKSFSALNPLPKPPLKVAANKVPRVGVPRMGVLSENKTKTTARVGIKRPNESSASEVKNKVMKKSKVPDWDYKTRFKLLQEKHNELDKKYNELDKKYNELDKKYQISEKTNQEVEKITDLVYEKLKTNNENLSIAEITDEFNKVRHDLEQKVEKISELYEESKTNYENLAIKYAYELEKMNRKFTVTLRFVATACAIFMGFSQTKSQN